MTHLRAYTTKKLQKCHFCCLYRWTRISISKQLTLEFKIELKLTFYLTRRRPRRAKHNIYTDLGRNRQIFGTI